MSDLISRSKLLKVLSEAEDNYRAEHHDCVMADEPFSDGILSTVFSVIKIVKSQPTAYDIDKVVEKLETNKQNALEVEESIKEYNVWDEAIEIVKQGGVSDDACEWEKGSSGYVGYPAYYSKCCATKSNGLEMQTHIIADWKYCPYCGKKIKVVE